MCSDLQTRQIKWISRHDQLKNGSRPSQYIHWGVPATVIAAQYSEVRTGESDPLFSPEVMLNLEALCQKHGV
jgi:hypothetical protein